MSCPSSFSPDFYNNVAAIAAVLMFTKVVAHRSRRAAPRVRFVWLHTFAVFVTALVIGAALLATDRCSDSMCFRWIAWIGLGLAVVALVGDVLEEDFARARGHRD
jgi:steroid 5-alpha reductase family enzyme